LPLCFKGQGEGEGVGLGESEGVRGRIGIGPKMFHVLREVSSARQGCMYLIAVKYYKIIYF